MLLLDYKSGAGCFQHGAGCLALLSRAHLLKAGIFLFPHCSSVYFLCAFVANPSAQVQFPSSPYQIVAYLRMKSWACECLSVDTERVIVSPSADPCLNRRLSASSHTKGHAALHHLKRAIVQNKKVEWPKYLTEAQNTRTWSNSLFCPRIVSGNT